ncbi:hypothetical protein E2562_034993 [Oryza meyeriana var. granulata]|uniref:Uncharacterized protein n=1 Tax=Oryza meyeriana var. granulata TaxID=110450 RepID=A0A6G1CMC1_9ORYZ|nr:hypothetical protein E2562_034993 [Oryza meyeriana var. granulata]
MQGRRAERRLLQEAMEEGLSGGCWRRQGRMVEQHGWSRKGRWGPAAAAGARRDGGPSGGCC